MPDKPTKTVLIINDDLLEAANLSLALLNEGFEPLIAESAEAAFRMAQRFQIDSVLIGDQPLRNRMQALGVDMLVLNDQYPKDTVWGRLTVDDQLPLRMEPPFRD